jgi:hypothetical protein
VSEPAESRVDQGGGGEARRAAQLFDLRTIIAVLFGFYGIVLTIQGLVAVDAAQRVKAAGSNINLWAGIAMLVVAALFVLWVRLRPLVPPQPDRSPGSPTHPPS